MPTAARSRSAIFRTLRELGIGTVAVYSEADRGKLHVEVADDAYLVGPGPSADSYLRGDRIVDAALRAGAEAIHPGYGFLAENAAFARTVEEAGLTWIGPPPEAIEAMGSKIAARERMQAAGVPIIPGATTPAESVEDVIAAADEIGYPIAIKASAGGGGKGLRIARSHEEVERAFETARREGESYFADPTVYVERYLDDPRHVEVQVLADAHGNVIHLGERDCTIQRRHQKLVEETPSPAVDAELRARIGAIAVDAARAVGYRSAGTIEGLLAPDGSYYFLEMNTRVQVEHTVTEAVTGIDIVREQVLIAAGEPLSMAQEDVVLRGHAIECRVNAEDVTRGFLPSPGRITAYREPGGIGVRVDSGVRVGDEISGLYDPMIAKLDRPRHEPRARPPPHAPRARGVRDRRPDDAARLPSRAALVAVLRRRRDVRGHRRVRGARAPGRGARVADPRGGSGLVRPQARAGRGGRARRTTPRGPRRHAPSRPGSSSRDVIASGRRASTAETTGTSGARCRAPCSR